VENSLVTMESTLLYIGVLVEVLVVEWLLRMTTLPLVGRCDEVQPPLLAAVVLVAEAADEFAVRADLRQSSSSSSPSSTIRSSPKTDVSHVCSTNTNCQVERTRTTLKTRQSAYLRQGRSSRKIATKLPVKRN